MLASPDPRPQLGAAPPPGLVFTEAWAALVRSLAFYPETNSRIRSAVASTLEALAVCQKGQPLRVAFGRDEAFVGDELIEFASGTRTAWLAERLDACGVGGALFEPGLREDSLVTFSRQVLDSFRRSTLDPDFEYWTAEPVEHVHVLQRRFEGVFDGGTGTGSLHIEGEASQAKAHTSRVAKLMAGQPHASLAVQLLADPRIEQRVLDLAKDHGDPKDPQAECLPAVDLVGRLVESLPAEAMLDLELAAKHTLALLAELDKESEQDDLGQAILRAGQRIFGRDAKQPDQIPVVNAIPASSRGHSRDEGITDDLDLLQAELEELPRSSQADVHLHFVERPDEQLGVYLHYLVTLEEDEQVEILHAPLAGYLAAINAEGRAILASYIEPMCDEAERPATDLHRRRVLEFLGQFDMTQVLAEYGAFSASMACALFPQDFGVWLDSHDFDREDDHAELVEVLEELGSERIMEAGPQLVAKARITRPSRARKLLSRGHPALVPLARLLLSRGESSLKGTVALYARKLESLGEEACLLEILPDEDLPRDYLATLLAPPSSPIGRDRLHKRISETLCDFIENTKGLPQFAPRRLEAVRRLGTFECPRSLELLRDLVRARRHLVLPAENRELRMAARQALASRS